MHGGVTASRLPGTTLGLTELSLDNGQSLYDTPGLIVPTQITNRLLMDELAAVLPQVRAPSSLPTSPPPSFPTSLPPSLPLSLPPSLTHSLSDPRGRPAAEAGRARDLSHPPGVVPAPRRLRAHRASHRQAVLLHNLPREPGGVLKQCAAPGIRVGRVRVWVQACGFSSGRTRRSAPAADPHAVPGLDARRQGGQGRRLPPPAHRQDAHAGPAPPTQGLREYLANQVD